MLKPHDRQLFLESLQPPTGYQLDFAVGTTYSLDLNAMLAAPVAFAFSDCQDADGKPVIDPLVLLKSVRQYSQRIALFCQAGKVYVPSNYQSLLCELENSIFPCVAPLGGSFHPKIWLIRYTDKEDIEPVVYRLLCLSRNLTFDRAWDTSLCLEGFLSDRTRAYAMNHPIGAFTESLIGMSTVKPTIEWKKRLKTLAHEVRRVDFEIPVPFNEMVFHPMGLESAAETIPLPDNPSRVLVVSPFLSAGVVNELCNRSNEVQLISRMENLDKIGYSTLEQVKQIWVFDEATETEALDLEEQDDAIEDSDDRMLAGLHAKLFIADSGWDAHILTGSANATHSAFNRNVEFLVELIGKKSKCGVDAVMGTASEADSKKEANCLLDILRPYHADEGQISSVDTEEIKFEKRMEELASLLAQSKPSAVCQHAGEEKYAIEVCPNKRFTRRAVLAGAELSIRPVSVSDAYFQSLEPHSKTWAKFEQLTCLALTAFYVVQAKSVDHGFTKRFILQAPIENPPETRREQILKHLLSDRSRVLRFLLMLLSDSSARDFAGLFNPKTKCDPGSGAFGGLFNATLFESLLQSLDREPQRVEQVGGIIADLKKSESGRDLLPEGLDEIWAPIWQVYQELNK